MTLQEFVDAHRDKCADWDGRYGGQCVDLFRFYCNEVLGIQQPAPVVGAKDFYDAYENDPILQINFDRFLNLPEAVPVKGDVILWNQNAGSGYGHIAIFLKGTVKEFDSFDQNWPTISKCTITHHGYSNVLGWLRPKKEII
jgi:hypothetical protein